MNVKGVLSVVLCFIFTINADFVEDYCWRDYDGVIPSDAFKAGIDRDGKPIYIGQVLFEDKLIPGKIHHDSNDIHIEFHKARVLNETIKILCTSHPEHFKWIATSTNDVLDVGKNHHLFEGGFEKRVTTYIGRTKSFDELTVGKVICWETYCIPLSTVEQGQYHTHGKFEILSYGPNGKAETITSETLRKSTETPTPLEPVGPVEESFVVTRRSVSPGWYVFLVIGTAILIVAVIILVRRC
ncbi:hypothetical protein ILUMI_01512 [Ignelater luminosus]|uniref:Uncharacterized protein n=1 Tax=Ignelater luminosus TaxID=2038154 RepID=A0A8K0DK00_IGNLU|nr:hypothetical protein ILUMI_01512 [Ignelater luminosus]